MKRKRKNKYDSSYTLIYTVKLYKKNADLAHCGVTYISIFEQDMSHSDVTYFKNVKNRKEVITRKIIKPHLFLFQKSKLEYQIIM